MPPCLNIGRFQTIGTQIIEKCTTSGGRTKEANERSFVLVHQHGGDDVTSKPPIGPSLLLYFADNESFRSWPLGG